MYKKPTLSQIRAYTKDEVSKLNENLKQIQNSPNKSSSQNLSNAKTTQDFATSQNLQIPIYEVRLSQKLRTLREELLAKKSH